MLHFQIKEDTGFHNLHARYGLILADGGYCLVDRLRCGVAVIGSRRQGLPLEVVEAEITRLIQEQKLQLHTSN